MEVRQKGKEMTSERGRMASRDASLFDALDRAGEKAGVINMDALYGALSNTTAEANELLQETARLWAKMQIQKEALPCAGYFACYPRIRLSITEIYEWIRENNLQVVHVMLKNEEDYPNNWIDPDHVDHSSFRFGKGVGFVVKDQKLVEKSLGTLGGTEKGLPFFVLRANMLEHDLECELTKRNYRLITAAQTEALSQSPTLIRTDGGSQVIRRAEHGWIREASNAFPIGSKETGRQLLRPTLIKGMPIYAEPLVPKNPTFNQVREAKLYAYQRKLPCPFATVEACRTCEFSHNICEACK